MSDRDRRIEAAVAERLREDPALKAILADLETHATDVAIGDFEYDTRERARQLALAIRTLRVEIQNRIDSVLIIDHNQRRAAASE